jgi:glucokinase
MAGERLASGNFVDELYKAAVEENVMICRIALDTFLSF